MPQSCLPQLPWPLKTQTWPNWQNGLQSYPALVVLACSFNRPHTALSDSRPHLRETNAVFTRVVGKPGTNPVLATAGLSGARKRRPS